MRPARVPSAAFAVAVVVASLALAEPAVAQGDSDPAAPSATAVLRAIVLATEGSDRKVATTADLGVGTDGSPIVVADGRLVKLPEWTPLSEPGVRVDRFSIGPGGVPFIVSGNRLGLLTGGKFTEIAELPNTGMAVETSESGGAVYVYGQEADGRNGIYRLERKDGKLFSQKWVQVKERIGTVRSVGEDIFFTVGDNLYRAGLGSDGKLFTVLVTTVMGMDIIDLERDDTNKTLYIASRNAIRSYRAGTILPVLDTGGHIRLSRQFLFILEAARPQVLVLERPDLAVPSARR